MNLKNLNEQTIVITGATSGIGLTTARMAAEQGAKLVLVARNEEALRQLTDEINANGGNAIYSVADVADENALRLNLAHKAVLAIAVHTVDNFSRFLETACESQLVLSELRKSASRQLRVPSEASR